MTASQQRIVCLGWGSLIWDQTRPFPVKGDWQVDGPKLPLEFARQSSDNRMTLVIVDAAKTVDALWAELNTTSINEAIEMLAKREGVQRKQAIGRWPNDTSEDYPHEDTIETWARKKNFSGVVWTALKPGMKAERGKIPSFDDVRSHLASLSEEEAASAAEYILKAPRQVNTPFRPALEQILSPQSGD